MTRRTTLASVALASVLVVTGCEGSAIDGPEGGQVSFRSYLGSSMGADTGLTIQETGVPVSDLQIVGLNACEDIENAGSIDDVHRGMAEWAYDRGYTEPDQVTGVYYAMEAGVHAYCPEYQQKFDLLRGSG